MEDYVAVQVLLLAFRAFIGEQNLVIQQFNAARRLCNEQRSRSRRRVALWLRAQRRSPVAWAHSRSKQWWDTVVPDFSSHSVLGDRPACNATRALNSATAMLESMQEDTTLEQTSTEPDLAELDVGEELLQLTPCGSSSPAPSSSSSRASASGQSRPGKRKRDPADMLDYLERADDKFLEHSREMNTALLQKLDDHVTAYVALMGRMVTLLEAQQKK